MSPCKPTNLCDTSRRVPPSFATYTAPFKVQAEIAIGCEIAPLEAMYPATTVLGAETTASRCAVKCGHAHGTARCASHSVASLTVRIKLTTVSVTAQSRKILQADSMYSRAILMASFIPCRSCLRASIRNNRRTLRSACGWRMAAQHAPVPPTENILGRGLKLRANTRLGDVASACITSWLRCFIKEGGLGPERTPSQSSQYSDLGCAS